jgi:hypothetical protein
VDVKVKMDGFAIVPYPPPALAGGPLDDEADPDDPEFARVLEFKHRRKARRRRRAKWALPCRDIEPACSQGE